ncbi:MAG: pilus assembly protein [Chromatiaceae bacterium]
MKPTTTRTLTGIAVAITGFTLATAAVSGPMGCRGGGAAFTEQRLERMTERLGLSTDQQDRIRVILDEQRAVRDLQRQETHQRIDKVLTQAQRDARDRFIATRIERRLDRMAERLDLTTDQTQQIRAVMEERIGNPQMSRAEIRDRVSAVLTDEQRDQLEAMGGRHGRMF